MLAIRIGFVPTQNVLTAKGFDLGERWRVLGFGASCAKFSALYLVYEGIYI